jgi:hypothetical protein
MSRVRIDKLRLNTRRAKYVPIPRYIGTSTFDAENPDVLRTSETLLFSHLLKYKTILLYFNFSV